MMYIPQIVILLCFMVASNALGHCKGKCEVIKLFTISTPLKSEVFLPCSFETSSNTANKTDSVRWSHLSSLLEITQDGNIVFDDPREGRVTVFPILAAVGNYSIIIYNVQASDFGSYCCELNRECWQLYITETTHTDPYKNNVLNPWIYFAAGAGLVILLFIIAYMFLKLCGGNLFSWTGNGVNRSTTYVNRVQTDGRSRGIATVYM